MLFKTICATLLLVGACKFAESFEDDCSTDTLQLAGNAMHFTKEATNDEFAIVGTFKGLHCCARGYRSIEWYKDGRIYPWELGVSRLIISPENANQTIFTPSIRLEDEGNYTCILRNDTHQQGHTINLRVFDKLPDELKITYVSPNQHAYLGQNLRLFCEAFAGRINLPDAHYNVEWYKKLENGTLVHVPQRISQKKVSRENQQTFGTYLKFPALRREDFGEYTCEIKKPGTSETRIVKIGEKLKILSFIDPNPFPTKEVLLYSIIAVVIVVTMLTLVKQFYLPIQVYWKDRFNTVEENDGKTHDVLVAYSVKDSELASGVLVPTLQARGYRCITQELTSDISQWNTELAGPIQTCRRVITVMSPATLNDSWISSNLYQALKQLQNLESTKLIFVMLKELPSSQNETKNQIGETLGSLSRSMNIIIWQRQDDETFWLRLCKDLPPKRVALTQHTQRPRLTSERSFDSLVQV